MADYQIKITAVDNATPIVDKAFKNTQKSATDVSGKIGQRFRDVFENVTQNATGAFGSVAGGLFKLPGAAGIAAAAILAVGGAAVTAAKKYAEANAANDTASAQFLANLDKLKGSFSGLVNTVGSAAVGVFNALAEAFGTAASAQEILLRQQKAYDELIIKQVSDTDAYVKKLGELLDANERLDEVGRIRDYFDAFAKGNSQLAAAYAKNISLLRTQQIFEKGLAEAQKNKSNIPQAQKPDTEKIITQQRQLFKESGEFLTLFSDVQPRLIEGKREEVRYAVELSDYAQAYLDKLRAQEQTAQAVGAAIKSQLVDSLEQAIFQAEGLHNTLKNIVNSFLRLGFRIITNSLFGLGFENGGILGKIPQAASGMMVNHDSLIRVGERNLPEVIIPLAPQKRDRANELMAQSGLAGNQTINFAPVIYANNADRNLVRELMTQFNRETRRGTKLYATNYKSNRR